MKRRNRVSDEVLSLVGEAQASILRRPEARPCLLVLYGSEARGDATPESDIDLLVVLESENPRAVEAVDDAVYEVMWRHDFNRLISVLTLSKEEFEEQRRKGFSFVRNVEREGIVLWQAA
ncbi:MAG: nucleotidyltransferase domain-containing protein [Chloroflexi bacterium]|nr:nucleotidyltransferase domain-containing protein [Chloroflexota bacterium]